MGHIGFGCYRVSVRSKAHREAMVAALKAGCQLIDTSANYTNGESEELVGTVLKDHPEFKPIIVTKAGYIQGKNLAILEELHSKGLALEDVVDLGETLKHSIHPDFLSNQISLSLKRMGIESIDIFLLHNPEYYLKTEGATQDEFYARIEKAFHYLEEEVNKGRIKSYGISSNNFVLPMNDPEVTDFNRILDIAKKLGTKNHFSTIQFPFNLIEIGALEKFGDYGETSLLESAQLNNIKTMINRPLNAFTNNQLVRLATYDTALFDTASAEADFETCMKQIEAKWNENTKDDELSSEEDFKDVPLIKQFTEIWKTLPTPDAVDQVFHGHFFPFIARIWGANGLNAKEAEPFFKLLDHATQFSRMNMTKKAQDFKSQAINVGLLPESDKPFAVDVLETYLDYGFDYVLLGMKNIKYVEQVKHLF